MKKMTMTPIALAVAALFWGAGLAQAAEEKAIIAGGCFWCVESDFEGVNGVIEAVSGYTGGTSQNPTYDNHDGHFEAVEVTFDNDVITYPELIALFLRSVDVVDAGGQFCDRGPAYATAIFPLTPKQKAEAKAQIKKAEADLGQKIVTPVRDATTFWKAEDYHQDYYKGNNWVLTRSGLKRQSSAYKFYRNACGRDARVHELWGKQAAFAAK